MPLLAVVGRGRRRFLVFALILALVYFALSSAETVPSSSFSSSSSSESKTCGCPWPEFRPDAFHEYLKKSEKAELLSNEVSKRLWFHLRLPFMGSFRMIPHTKVDEITFPDNVESVSCYVFDAKEDLREKKDFEKKQCRKGEKVGQDSVVVVPEWKKVFLIAPFDVKLAEERKKRLAPGKIIPNVFMFMLDTTSRSRLNEWMPKTVAAVGKLAGKRYSFERMHHHGGSSIEAKLPLHTGLIKEEVLKSDRKTLKWTFDEAAKRGYVTTMTNAFGGKYPNPSNYSSNSFEKFEVGTYFPNRHLSDHHFPRHFLLPNFLKKLKVAPCWYVIKIDFYFFLLFNNILNPARRPQNARKFKWITIPASGWTGKAGWDWRGSMICGSDTMT
jgi:hypothetical protein